MQRDIEKAQQKDGHLLDKDGGAQKNIARHLDLNLQP